MTDSSFPDIGSVYKRLDEIPMFQKRGVSAANFSLDNIKSGLDFLGDPHKDIPAIHVAGTNGKGTVCRMLASVFQSAGYRVALYTSPHLTEYRERFRVNGKSITDDDLLRFFQTYGDLARSHNLTYFELSTVIAFWHFSEKRADLSIIETGLGGRLDATNVIKPVVSVITSVGMDHQDVLGSTIEGIAAEKAGIIKQDTPVVIGRLDERAEDVIRKTVQKKNSKVYSFAALEPVFADRNIQMQSRSGVINIDAKSRTKIDVINVATAYQAVIQTNSLFPVSDEQFTDGIARVDDRYPHHAHFQKLHQQYPWYFDGAHNEESIGVMLEQLGSIAPLEEWTLVLSMMKDKLSPELLTRFQQFKQVYISPLKSERAASYADFLPYLPDSKLLPADNLPDSGWIEKHKSELVIFGGSFYFYSMVSRWMGAIATNT